MTEKSAYHSTFTLERKYKANPAKAFAAWATVEAKSAWYGCVDGWVKTLHEFDFTVGGRERLKLGPAGGPVHHNETVFMDIVPNERIVYSYAMHIDARRISVSLATVEFIAEGTGTRLVFTEQGVFLDGYDGAAEREHGTKFLLENIAKTLGD